MIISHIIGGLGNQMFQYAAGHAVALRTRQPLHLDISAFANYNLHQGFELQRLFDAPVTVATENEIRKILGWKSSAFGRRFANRFPLLRGSNLIIEPHFHFWPGIERAAGNCYMRGYWQSEKYFKDCERTIRSDFKFKQPLADRNAELAAHIGQSNAVSLHVRRGDYVKNPQNASIYGACSLEYYRAAVRYIADRAPQPIFYVFSDDMPWVKENLQLDFPCTYTDYNHGADSFYDMQLMSLCRHHIIANSSFSWWGAWLNARSDKIVIAPKNWFVNGNNIKDLFPANWIVL